jgi:hypothetical protein
MLQQVPGERSLAGADLNGERNARAAGRRRDTLQRLAAQKKVLAELLARHSVHQPLMLMWLINKSRLLLTGWPNLMAGVKEVN